MSRFPTPLLAALPLLASLATAQSNTSTIIDRAEQGPPSAPLAPSSAPNSPEAPGAGSDEGTQRVAEPRRLPFKFSVNFDEQFYGTDNIFLAEDGSSQSSTDAIVSVTTLGLRAESLPFVLGRGQLTASAGFSYQRYVHGIGNNDNEGENDAIAALDFESYALPLGVFYRWGRGWEASACLAFSQLHSVRGENSHEKLYASTTASVGLRNQTQLRRDLILSSGINLAHGETWTSLRDAAPFIYRDDRNDKLDASADVALYFIRGQWNLIPYLSLRQTHYYHYEEAGDLVTGARSVDRDDTTLSAGLSVAWNFAPWGSARAFTSYDERFSRQDLYTYDAGTLGLGVSLNLRY